MAEFEKVAGAGALKPGEMQMVEVRGRSILLCNVSGKLYAIGGLCTHAECALSEGVLEGEEVECPCHGGRFNVKTGVVVLGPAEENEPTYQVRVEGGDILVGPY